MTMTPEEQFTLINNTLQALIERQVQFELEHEKFLISQAATDRQVKELAQSVARVAAAQEVTEVALQKLIERVDEHGGRLDKLDPRRGKR